MPTKKFLIIFVSTFTSVFKDNKSLRSQKAVESKVFFTLFCTLMEGSVQIITDQNLGGPETYLVQVVRIRILNTANKVPVMYTLFFVSRPHGCFETEEDLNHRLDVLSRLNDLVRQWIKVGAPPAVPGSTVKALMNAGFYELRKLPGTRVPVLIPFRSSSCFTFCTKFSFQRYRFQSDFCFIRANWYTMYR
jgi:hypothetical protein